jgi:uncharacterized protein (DUF305 family)
VLPWPPRIRGAAALALLAALTLAGCGDDEGATGSGDSGADHNDADVAFADDMIQHHAQALAMVDLTVGRELAPEVQALAEGIRAAQAPEIETMADWLTQWGEPVPATVRDHVNADDHGDEHGDDHGDDHGGEPGDDTGMDMPGMMSDAQMDELAAAQDTDFEELFLELMIEHHEGAVDMAREEQESGRFPAAIALAEQIESSQEAEIAAMQGLLP